MKNIFKKSYLLVISIFLIFSANMFAQDTVTVDPGFNVLQAAIDANPGKVIKLKRGGMYTVDAEVQINQPTVIVGEKSPVDLPPATLNTYSDPGQAGKLHIFQINADFEIHYCGLVGHTVGEENIDAIFNILVPDLTFVLDNCTVQSTRCVYWAGRDSLNIQFTNNTFWGIYWNGWWNGGYMGNWTGNDVTFNFENNTVIGAGRVLDALAVGPHALQRFNHNTYIDVSGEIYYLRYNDDFVVTNNIFYNIYHRGYVGPRPSWGYGGDYVNVTTDSIEGCIELHPLRNEGIDDYARDIRINNNLRYTSDDVFAYMEDITANWQPMFSTLTQAYIDTFGWKVENNMFEEVTKSDGHYQRTGVDPQFVIDPNSTPLRDGQDYWNVGERDSTRRDLTNWPPYPTWYPTNPATGEPFKRYEVVWPITNFLNFKPTNQDIWFAGDDGFPLGDLHWFDPEVLEAWRNGEENPLVSVDEKQPEIPTEYGLEQNYPNPFNPTTKISYSIPVAGNVSLKVFNAIGQEVATLVSKEQAPGNYSVNFDASQLSSGVYLYRIQVNDYTASKKMMLLK